MDPMSKINNRIRKYIQHNITICGAPTVSIVLYYEVKKYNTENFEQLSLLFDACYYGKQ